MLFDRRPAPPRPSPTRPRSAPSASLARFDEAFARLAAERERYDRARRDGADLLEPAAWQSRLYALRAEVAEARTSFEVWGR